MPNHVVVDGSNIATEGRSMPSLQQLNDAVLAFIEENPDALITVVVDATFGHRIDPRETAEFDAAVANNELVAPPAGAIGRGDAFVLSIAHKVKARILTNDSYQEFHAEYPWLFDEGRLIGGKPVPHVGWVFVNRLPVRGPVSRKATADARRRKKPEAAPNAAIVGSVDASQPMPVPKAPPPRATRAAAAVVETETPVAAATPAPSGKRRRGRGGAAEAPTTPPATSAATAAATPEQPARSSGHGPVNELMPYLDFVAHHPVGTSVSAVVDHYSSHGAYVRIGDVNAYIPLRLMADPAPRSARELLKIGETHAFVVVSYVPDKRSIDLALPSMAAAATAAAPDTAESAPAPRKGSRRGVAPVASAPVEAAPTTTAPTGRPAKKTAAKKAGTAPTAAPTAAAAASAPAPARAKKAAAKKAATAKATSTTATPTAAPVAPPPAASDRPAAAKKAAPKKAAAKKAATAPKAAAPAKKAAVATTGVKKAATTKAAPAKKAPAKKAPAKKAPAKKAAAKKAAG